MTTSSGDLTGRVALVTGAGRGIGRAIALAVARAGADVALSARTPAELDETARLLADAGRRVAVLRADLSDRAAAAGLAQRAAEALGPVDVLVNNAAFDAGGPFQRIDDATWDRLLAVNVTAPFVLTRALLPSMYQRGWGRVLNVASVAGKVGLKYGAAYSATKHALVGLTRSLALECGRKGVTANALCPGWTETRMMEEAIAGISKGTGRTLEEARQAALAHNPLGRAATPEEVAAAAVAVLTNGAIHGQCVHIDGGEAMA